MKVKLLFVCLGNICRSPAAQGIMQELVKREGLEALVEIDSAGTYGGHAGELPDLRMRAAAKARGYDLCSRSRQIRSSDFDDFNMIIVMDDSNYERVRRLAPSVDAREKILRMSEFLTRHTIDHIPDPYYQGHRGFELVLSLLEDGCRGLLSQVKERLKS